MFSKHPNGLIAAALANMGERFGFYIMMAILTLFISAKFGLSETTTGYIYSAFYASIYILALAGGIIADKTKNFKGTILAGLVMMAVGYLIIAIPTPTPVPSMGLYLGLTCFGLLVIAFGNGLFKGNLQVMVGRLYDEPQYASKRDSGFSLFYMAINIGAMFAPTAAIKIMKWAQESLSVSVEGSYHFAFAVACASLIFSIAIYYAFSFTYKHVLASETKSKDDKTSVKETNELSKAETKERIICLCLVFAVVIFFWMAFHQNGNTLTLFARDYTQKTSEGLQSMAFDVTNLVACIFVVYGCFGLAQSKTGKGKGISLGVIVAAIAFLFYKYSNLEGAVDVEAPIFQQFNPCYVVALTPVSVALFSWLHKIGKEPTSPEKIGLGMLVAALGFVWMAVGSMGLELPLTQGDPATEGTRVSANLLISTYLILTFAELLLSPIGISFVSKVAPPKYAGLMMGLWFGATAIGNQLVMIPGIMWGQNFNLIAIWGVLAGICLVSAAFIFSIIKKLNRVS